MKDVFVQQFGFTVTTKLDGNIYKFLSVVNVRLNLTQPMNTQEIDVVVISELLFMKIGYRCDI